MNHGAPVSDEDLLGRLAAGDEEAFCLFYARHYGPLFRYALHMAGRSDTADEVVQESFMTLLREARKFDSERGAAAAFLFGIARNHVHRLLETDGHYLPLPAEGPTLAASALRGADLSEELERTEVSGQVRRAVLSLPIRYREVITLCDLEEMDYDQAATLLKCPIGTVRSRLNRAREMLVEKLRAVLNAPKPFSSRPTGTE